MQGFDNFSKTLVDIFFTNCSHDPVPLRSKNIPLLFAFGINDTYSILYIILDPKISGTINP